MTGDMRPRVLLVDDNDAILDRAAAILEPRCEIVGIATDGSSALKAVKSLHPDILVLDISLPGMSGFELATRLQRDNSPPRIVFLTVHDDDEFVTAAQAAGGLGYVVKPRLASDLLPAVMEAREGRRFVSRTK